MQRARNYLEEAYHAACAEFDKALLSALFEFWMFVINFVISVGWMRGSIEVSDWWGAAAVFASTVLFYDLIESIRTSIRTEKTIAYLQDERSAHYAD